MTPESSYSQQLRELIRYINDTPELLSMLYDMDLMPEQIIFPSRDGNLMIYLASWHKQKFGPVSLGNEPT